MARLIAVTVCAVAVAALFVATTDAYAVRGKANQKRARLLMSSTSGSDSAGLDGRAPASASGSLASHLQFPHAGIAPSDTPVVLHFALNHDDTQNSAQLDKHFWDVSMPGSPLEGAFLSQDEVAELMSPHPATMDRLFKWLEEEGMPSSSVSLSPWGDHLFVDTTAAKASQLTGLEMRAHRHTSPDPVLRGRLVVVAEAAELGPGHPHGSRVAIVRVAGTVAEDAKLQGVEEDSGAASDAAPTFEFPSYPFSFWPPSPIIAAEVLPSGTLIVEAMVTCHSWTSQPYPFESGIPNIQDPRSPCGSTYGEIESFTVTLTDSTGGSQSSTWYTTSASSTGIGCAESDFSVYSTYGTGLISLASCTFEMDGFSLTHDETYTVSIESELEFGSNGGSRAWVGQPNALPLRVSHTTVKLPSDVHSFYGVPADPVACEEANGQSIGVLQSSYSGFYSDSDLESFYGDADVSSKESDLVQFVGSVTSSPELLAKLEELGYQIASGSVDNEQSEPGDETTLDVEWISGTAPGAVTSVYHGGYFVSTSTYESMDPMLAVILAIQYAAKPPLVLSMSYGMRELGVNNQTRTYEESFKAMGVLGISVLASSGDAGALSPSISATATCDNPQVNYPASSPHVTGVGATQMKLVNGVATEVVASIETGSLITSGGGFSAQFPAPQWQQEALAAYKQLNPSANTQYRGVPDISLWGHNYGIVLNGRKTVVDGTSCSSPTFAALVTLINDARLRAGQQPLGFLSPKLYSAYKNNSAVVNDITIGDNKCAGGNGGTGICCTAGYEATAGWDPTTGLGTPAFMELSTMLLGGNTWVSGTCSVDDRACSVAGDCTTSLPWWAYLLIIAGCIGCISTICFLCLRGRKRYRPALNVNATTGTGAPVATGAYTQMGAPANTYGQRQNTYGQPQGMYGQPQQPQQVPPPSYAQANNQGSAYPQPTYGQQPTGTYGQASGNAYGQPSGYNYQPPTSSGYPPQV